MVQWNPLNVITLGLCKIDYIIQMITITGTNIAKKAYWVQIFSIKVITVANMIALTGIMLSRFLCIVICELYFSLQNKLNFS